MGFDQKNNLTVDREGIAKPMEVKLKRMAYKSYNSLNLQRKPTRNASKRSLVAIQNSFYVECYFLFFFQLLYIAEVDLEKKTN